MKNTIILLVLFVNLVVSLGLPIINGYIGGFLKTNRKTGKLLMKSKKFIQNPQIKDIEGSEMI